MNPMRVYIRPDKSVVKAELSPKTRLPGESEADWLKRMWARMEACDCNLHEKGDLAMPVLPHADVTAEDIPAGTTARDLWRWDEASAAVVVVAS